MRDFGERAMFCPECGQALTEASSEKEPQEASPVAGGVSADHKDVPELQVAGRPEVSTGEPAPAQSESSEKPIVEERHGARERTRETLHRASSVARGAIEGNVKRVEKIHHVSTVMLEEATYDPSLRFVLVALGLFVVFVILLVVSKVMG